MVAERKVILGLVYKTQYITTLYHFRLPGAFFIWIQFFILFHQLVG